MDTPFALPIDSSRLPQKYTVVVVLDPEDRLHNASEALDASNWLEVELPIAWKAAILSAPCLEGFFIDKNSGKNKKRVKKSHDMMLLQEQVSMNEFELNSS